ncbi:hypothetical protein IEQ34_025525 [Dendrobium chrysotoxum]|uniref:Pre-mRNA-splicing factor Syf1/CRNKL1-like C-terminal HAT-repeats domain-containing protein n=1 Tax=Dendrobium chrysotoxum TaxID=161865 RepID=A0AAV7FPA0_DENCH|nr:hypothetical protein IEQ34_025525 [Dendrobium chrysotoxum]
MAKRAMSIYERATERVPSEDRFNMYLFYVAKVAANMGLAATRPVALYAHASQFCDPRTDKAFWSQWNAFEIEHGTEDTFREMLRIRRSVQAQFNTDASYIAAHADAQRDAKTVSAAAIDDGDDPMSKVEQQSVARNGAPLGFVAAKQSVEQPDVAQDVSNAEKISGNANGGAQDDEADDDEDLM